MDFLLSQNNLYIVLIAIASGIMLLWPTLGNRRSGTVQVSEAVQLVNQKHGIFLDIRSPEQFKAGTIPQARNMPEAELEAKLASLPKDKPIIVICDVGRDATRAVALLRKHGYNEAVALSGGLRSWADAGMPLSKKA